MVRLKDWFVNKITSDVYGFQFLMVRLKAGDYAFYNSNFRFQFLMVRLKGEYNYYKDMQSRNFNSLWCD